MSNSFQKKLIILGASIIFLVIAFVICVDVVNIEGYEVGIVHKWSSGVQDGFLSDGVHFVWFGNCHKIRVGTQKLTFAEQKANDTEGEDTADNEFDVIEVACGNEGGQKVKIVLTVQYHLDKPKSVQLYKDGIHKNYEYVTMKRTIIDVVNEKVRPKEALEIYSGEGFNALRVEIDTAIKGHEQFTSRGIVIETATLYDIKLDAKYEEEIQGKQLAKQKTLRAVEEEKASVAMAKAETAIQQVMVEKRRAEADALKIEVVTAAEGVAEQEVLRAEASAKARVAEATAEKQELALQGEGQMEKDVFEAKGIEALGIANAKAAEALKMAQYSGVEGSLRAKVEVAGLLADKLKGLLAGVNIIGEKAFLALSSDGVKVPLTLTDVGVGAAPAPKK